MRVIAVVLAQVIIAVLVGGLIMPAVLFSVPQTRQAGPLVLLLLVALMFGLLLCPGRRPNATASARAAFRGGPARPPRNRFTVVDDGGRR